MVGELWSERLDVSYLVVTVLHESSAASLTRVRSSVPQVKLEEVVAVNRTQEAACHERESVSVVDVQAVPRDEVTVSGVLWSLLVSHKANGRDIPHFRLISCKENNIAAYYYDVIVRIFYEPIKWLSSLCSFLTSRIAS